MPTTAPTDTFPPECQHPDGKFTLNEWGVPHHTGLRFFQLWPAISVLWVYATCAISRYPSPSNDPNEIFQPGTYTRRKDGGWHPHPAAA